MGAMLKWSVNSTRVSTALSVTMTTLGMGTEIIADTDKSQEVEYTVLENWEDPTEISQDPDVLRSSNKSLSPESSPERSLSSPETSLSSPETSLSSPETSSSPGISLSQKTVTFKENSKLCEIKVFQAVKCDFCTYEFRSKEELATHVETAHRKREGARCIICLKTVNLLEHFVI